MNKYLKLFFILFVSSLSLGFTSCDDDDDPDYAKEIAGTYKGTISALESEIPNAEIKIARKSENRVTISMNQDLGVAVVDVTAESDVLFSDKTYSVAGTATYEWTEGAEVTLPVEIKGTIDKDYNATINIVLGKGIELEGFPFPITAKFEGKKQ